MSEFNPALRPPVVTQDDIDWALSKCPAWCEPGYFGDDQDPFDEMVDDGAPLDLEPTELRTVTPMRKARAKGIACADGSVAYAARDIEPGTRFDKPRWGPFVDEQVEGFERYFAASRKSAAEWSKLFRVTWWAKVDPEKRFPHSKPLTVPAAGYVFLKPGTPLHAIALDFATSAAERQVWARYGCQFEGNNPTLAAIRTAAQQREAA